MSQERVRPLARPVAGRSLPGGRVADRLSLPPARILELLDAAYPAGRAESARRVRETLARGKHALLITFRAGGGRVATPVWAAVEAERVYVRTQRASGKVARVGRRPQVLLGVCSTRGRPLTGVVPATARVLPAGEERHAERLLHHRYGAVRAFCATAQDLMRVDMCYLEITVGDDNPAG
ncbi:PPOX class F420-dependent oxidoreductase [Streptomyces marincola]|uniref:Pyridoxamine 5'-phosphate oxidase putative domain-containing protein n=1 Tax=Streptomyces marincola TaxID=2878388 RepID=A0A1W7D4V1_9ACTN|nr:PPOX class F420-dependent oxidoreductase [Streptomyces marincola]ARQ71977.1 hypothetical protein CAG99_26910 [Streptomyces marincola]